jgi:putative GTP pyrophosphokinase
MVLYGCPVPYSKNRVNRAGELCSQHLRAIAVGKQHGKGNQAELTEAIAIIDWWRSEHAKSLSRVGANLHSYAAVEGKPIVTQRLKKLQTMIGKLFREPGMKLGRMEDIGGVRAVLPSQDACYRVASQIRRNWTITRFRDYVTEPKPDGYRALHLINRNRGRLIEVQLRTQFQDSWANIVEEFSRVAAPGLKFGGGPREMQDYLRVLSGLGARRDQGLDADLETVARLRDLRPRVDTLLNRAINEP